MNTEEKNKVTELLNNNKNVLNDLSIAKYGKLPEQLSNTLFTKLIESLNEPLFTAQINRNKKDTPKKYAYYGVKERASLFLSDKSEQYVTNSHYLIIDKKIAPDLRDKYWEIEKKRLIKAFIKEDLTFTQAEIKANDIIKENRNGHCPDYEHVIPNFRDYEPAYYQADLLIPTQQYYKHLVVLSNGISHTFVNNNYYRLIMYYFPKVQAKMTTEDGIISNKPVCFFVNNELKAIIMPVRYDDINIPFTTDYRI